MTKFNFVFGTACAISLASASAQQLLPIDPLSVPIKAASTVTANAAAANSATPVSASELPSPIDPPIAPVSPAASSTTSTGATTATSNTTPDSALVSGSGAGATNITNLTSGNNGGHALNEFQGDDAAQVLRLLARQAKINIVVSDKVEAAQMKVTMRLEDKTPLEAIRIIARAKSLVIDEQDGVYYVKTKEERESEPTEGAFYTFSYAMAEKVAPLLASQLASKVAPQFDSRTNTIFYRETDSNMKNIRLFLETIDRPTQQVMIEARLVEVTANPKQSYGLNWAGVVGGSSAAQTFRAGGSGLGTSTINLQTNPTTGSVTPVVVPSALPTATTNSSTGTLQGTDFLRAITGSGALQAIGGQFAILSAPQMSLTMRMLNEDSDAEFLANPRVVTANNQQATIKITRNQPVPQLNFNEQTATAVFGGFQDKEFGNTLVVTPSINKDKFVTLLVKPEISNKVGDAVFNFAGATVSSPIIDKRNLESNVLIKSGDTLAIGGLLQDEVTKSRTKVPVLGDIPLLGYAFQERLNERTKRNLLVFVTPTIINQGYGTGLEDQVNGLHHSGEEFADPNGWRNNAKGAVRLVPSSNRQVVSDYPKPGAAPAPDQSQVKYKVSTSDREQ